MKAPKNKNRKNGELKDNTKLYKVQNEVGVLKNRHFL
jgi:hypothetical protein